MLQHSDLVARREDADFRLLRIFGAVAWYTIKQSCISHSTECLLSKAAEASHAGIRPLLAEAYWASASTHHFRREVEPMLLGSRPHVSSPKSRVC